MGMDNCDLVHPPRRPGREGRHRSKEKREDKVAGEDNGAQEKAISMKLCIK